MPRRAQEKQYTISPQLSLIKNSLPNKKCRQKKPSQIRGGFGFLVETFRTFEEHRASMTKCA